MTFTSKCEQERRRGSSPVDVCFPEGRRGGGRRPAALQAEPQYPRDFSLAQLPVYPASLLPWSLLSSCWGPARWKDPASPSFIHLWTDQA